MGSIVCRLYTHTHTCTHMHIGTYIWVTIIIEEEEVRNLRDRRTWEEFEGNGGKSDRDADFTGVCFLINELRKIEIKFVPFLKIQLIEAKVDTVEVGCRSLLE